MVDNTDEIILALKKSKQGLTITGLVCETTLSRSQVRTSISFLKGAGEIEETKIGVAKLYTLK